MTENNEELTMSDQIELVSDGDGIAVIGAPSAVEQFLRTEGLGDTGSPAVSELPLTTLGSLGQITAAGMASSGSGCNSQTSPLPSPASSLW